MRSSLAKQQGIALIVVLMFLVLISIVGTIAVRQSRTDLQVATADQANTLTLNASDSVLVQLEDSIGQNPEASVLGYFLQQPKTKMGHQISFCYRPRQGFYNRSKARILMPGGGTSVNSNDAICDPANADDYTSARNVAMTQVTITALDDSAQQLQAENFGMVQTGTSDERVVDTVTPALRLHSTSLLPAMSNVDNNTIKGCLGRPVDNASKYGAIGANGNLSNCLKQNALPFSSLVQEVVISYQRTGGYNPTTGALD